MLSQDRFTLMDTVQQCTFQLQFSVSRLFAALTSSTASFLLHPQNSTFLIYLFPFFHFSIFTINYISILSYFYCLSYPRYLCFSPFHRSNFYCRLPPFITQNSIFLLYLFLPLHFSYLYTFQLIRFIFYCPTYLTYFPIITYTQMHAVLSINKGCVQQKKASLQLL